MQAEADRRKGAVPDFVTEVSGKGKVEAFTVIYKGKGEIEHGVVMMRTEAGRAGAGPRSRHGFRHARASLNMDRTPVGSRRRRCERGGWRAGVAGGVASARAGLDPRDDSGEPCTHCQRGLYRWLQPSVPFIGSRFILPDIIRTLTKAALLSAALAVAAPAGPGARAVRQRRRQHRQ